MSRAYENTVIIKTTYRPVSRFFKMVPKADLNRRPKAYESSALPLRFLKVKCLLNGEAKIQELAKSLIPLPLSSDQFP